MSNKYSVFHISGGIGKHVASTAVAKAIKNNHPDRKLIVVCYYPEIFLGLNFVDRVYHGNFIPYFYQDYVLGKDSLIFKGEPYDTTNHVHKKKHLIESWCEMFGIKWNGEKPELKFNMAHHSALENVFNPQKPVMLIQTSGGLYQGENLSHYKWSRDMPPKLARKIAYTFMNEYEVVQVKQKNGYAIQGVHQFDKELPTMQFLNILSRTAKRVLIDSSLQHASASMGLKSNVLWIGTDPKVFGYEIHNNIVANQLDSTYKLPDSFLFNYSFDGAPHECPYMDESDMFDFDEVVNSIKEN